MIPQNITERFEAADVEVILKELHYRFGFATREWKAKFEQALDRKPRGTTNEEFFLIFGNRVINPLLNEILCRPAGHPTFQNLVDYVLSRKPGATRPAGPARGSRKDR